jgi:hypothetical protein
VEDVRAAAADPVCFGCAAGHQGGRRRPNRAKFLVGDRQGHATLECARHAQLILDRGESWAIPIASLCVITEASDIGDALLQSALSEEAETVADKACPTYVRGFTLDLQRP